MIKLTARVGNKNGHTVYIDMPSDTSDRFVCVAMTPEAAEAVAETLTSSGLLERRRDWVYRLPAIPKREGS
jgi:hypothetical protein